MFEKLNSHHPFRNNSYTWRTNSRTGTGNPNQIRIPPDTSRGDFAVFIIGIRGNGNDVFDVISREEDQAVPLKNGEPTRAFVAEGKESLFSFPITDDTCDLAISYTPVSDRISLELGVVMDPNVPACDMHGCKNATWVYRTNQASGDTDNIMVIKASDPCSQESHRDQSAPCISGHGQRSSYTSGTAIIGVYGLRSSTFFISALLQCSTPTPIEVRPGIPVQTETHSHKICKDSNYANCTEIALPQQSKFFKLDVSSGTFPKDAKSDDQQIVFTISGGLANHGLPPSSLDIYIKSCHAHSCTDQDTVPGWDHHDLHAVTPIAGKTEIFMTNKLAGFCDVATTAELGNCQYYIAVYAYNRYSNPVSCSIVLASFEIVGASECPSFQPLCSDPIDSRWMSIF